MNTQERDMLNAFLTQLTQAQVGAKEPEADTLIAQALAKQPNAGYLLVQRAMQLDFVLQQSQAKVAELQAQLEGTENRISVHRMKYNESVKKYNFHRRGKFRSWALDMFGEEDEFPKKEMFEAVSENVEVAPKVEF